MHGSDQGTGPAQAAGRGEVADHVGKLAQAGDRRRLLAFALEWVIGAEDIVALLRAVGEIERAIPEIVEAARTMSCLGCARCRDSEQPSDT